VLLKQSTLQSQYTVM